MGEHVVYLGLPRTGSHWLRAALEDHDAVDCGLVKEIHYFDLHFSRGSRWYRTNYRRWGQATTFDLTAMYAQRREYIDRIASDFPGAKVVVVLREPVSLLRSLLNQDRSKFTFFSRREYRAGLNLSSFLEHPEVASLVHPLPILRNILGRFPRERVHIDFYEAFVEDSRAYFSRVARFLDVDDVLGEELVDRRVNEARAPRNAALNGVIFAGGYWLRKAGLVSLVDAVYYNERVRAILYSGRARPAGATEEEVRALWRRLHRDDAALAAVTGDLPAAWTRAPMVNSN